MNWITQSLIFIAAMCAAIICLDVLITKPDTHEHTKNPSVVRNMNLDLGDK